MALSMAIIGDIVSPRERGKYQGFFGMVFAVATIVGPLLGGFLVEQFSWRWVFYINVPIGIVALAVTGTVLKFDFLKRKRSIDYTGSALIMGSVSSLLLVTVWGGTQYSWSSPIIIWLAVLGVVGVLVTLWWESRAEEPIIPLYLFRNSIFNIASLVSFILALTMFGAIIYLPVYFQLVRADSPILSGLMLTPIMLGMIVTSTGTGFLVSKTGRYKIYPIIGCAIMAVALYLMSNFTISLSYSSLAWKMVLLGVGMGMIMQNMVIATQNSVDPRELGTATSANSFFRTLGGAFGTALLGTILDSRLNYWLPKLLPASISGKVSKHSINLVNSPAIVKALPPAIRSGVREAFVRSLHTEFIVTVPFALLALVLSFALKEVGLRTTTGLHASSQADHDEALEGSKIRESELTQ
jgi:EmrB/QacA subfamily drug resistance transporter